MTSGVVVWTTGLPSAGKSTFSRALSKELGRRGVSACVLDGDDVREALAGSLGYTSEERSAFYEVLARLAALLAAQGLVVLVAATAHRRAFRERARELWRPFVEVWVVTPVEECVRRDTKGLYRAQASGRATDVPGADTAYEAPVEADVHAHGGEDTSAVLETADRIERLRRGARSEEGT
jgi:adenylylsulfate kinase